MALEHLVLRKQKLNIMKKVRNNWIILAILNLIGFTSFAQGSIEGYIKNEENKALDMANVILIQNGVSIYGTVTDEDGFYFIESVKSGEYILQVSHSTNKTEEKISIKDREVLAYNSFIADVITTGTVVVGPKGPRNPIIDKNDIDVINITATLFIETGIKNVDKVLGTIPKTTKDKEGNISYRGSRPTDGAAFYVDGMRLAGSLDIPTSAIYTFKVYNGGIPARYGNTTSAVIDINTQPGIIY